MGTVHGSQVGDNVFVYRPAGTAGGQIYIDMEACYQDILQATSATSMVGGIPYENQTQLASITLIMESASMPPRAANAAYDLNNVTLVLKPPATGEFLFEDGVNFDSAVGPFYGIPFFAGPDTTNVVFECTTTSIYNGPVADMKLRGIYNWETGASATVPAFIFTGGGPTSGILLDYTALNVTNSGTSALFHLTGGSELYISLMSWSSIWFNPFTDDGGGDEAISITFVDSNGHLHNNAGTQMEPVYGSTMVVTTYVPPPTLRPLGRVLYVDGAFPQPDHYNEADGGYLKPFSTVQAAVDFAEANLNPTIDSPVVINIAPYPGPTGYYPENVVIKKSGVSLVGAASTAGTYLQRLIITNATAASLATFISNGGLTDPNTNWGDLVADSYGPTGDNTIHDIGLWDGSGTGYLLFELGVGAANTVAQSTHYFYNFTNFGKTFLRSVNSLDFRECYLTKVVDTVNVSQLSIARCFMLDYTGDYDTGLDEPTNGNTIGLYGGNGTSFNGGITLNNAAKVGGGNDGFNDTAITGNIDINDTALFACGPGNIFGNIDVEGDATLTLKGTHVQGNITLDNTGGAVACTFDGGRYMGTLTDAGLRLTRNSDEVENGPTLALGDDPANSAQEVRWLVPNKYRLHSIDILSNVVPTAGDIEIFAAVPDGVGGWTETTVLVTDPFDATTLDQLVATVLTVSGGDLTAQVFDGALRIGVRGVLIDLGSTANGIDITPIFTRLA